MTTRRVSQTHENYSKYHGRSKLHKTNINECDPVIVRDPQKVRKLIQWQLLWSRPCRTPTEVIEGKVTLEDLGKIWNTMAKGVFDHGEYTRAKTIPKRVELLSQVNFEEYLLGNASLPTKEGSIDHGDSKYCNKSNLSKSWNKFSEEEKKKIHKAYNWDFSFVYFDKDRNQDATYSTFLAQYQMHEEMAAKLANSLQPAPVSCPGCELYIGKREEDLSDVLDGMCLKCFRKQTNQTADWYDMHPTTRIIKEGVRIWQYCDSKGKWHQMYGNFVDSNIEVSKK